MEKKFYPHFVSILFCSVFFVLTSLTVQAQYFPGGFAKNKIGIWLDASDSATLTRTSGVITTWRDKANNLSATQSNAARRPKLSYVNGMPIVEFDSLQGLDIADTSFLDPQSGYNLAQAVYVYADASNSVSDFRCGTYTRNQSQGTPHIGIRYVSQDAKYEVSVNRNNTGYYISNYPDFRGKWGLVDNYVPTDNQYCYFGYNAKVDVFSTTLTQGIAPNYTNSATIGNRNNIYNDVHWGVSETVLSTTYLNKAGRKIIQLYLANKWNMIDTIPAALATLYWPSNPNFTNNLVAIGTEGASDSVTVTGSNNGLGFMNVNNYTGFLREAGDYLAAADNGLSGTLSAGTGFTRWNRAWYMDKTDVNGYGGLVNIFFDFTNYGIGNSLDTLVNDYYLLYNSTNGYFNSGSNIVIPVTAYYQIAGTKQLAFLVDALKINDGYYTIVYAPKGTAISNISLINNFTNPSISLTGSPTISKVFSGNTFNYLVIDSTTVNFAIAYYKIYAGKNGSALVPIDSTASVTSYFAHYNLQNDTSYTYAVSAVYAPGKEGPLSSTLNGVPNLSPPNWLSTPQYAGLGKISMSAYTTASFLPLKFMFANVSGGGNSSSYQTSNSFTDSNLVNGTTYGYRFKYMDTIKGVATESQWSVTQSTLLADSAKGGFTYNLSFLDPTTIWAPYGIGPSNVLPSTQDMTKVRFIKSAPTVGLHPRLFCNPEDSTSIRWRMKNTKSGIAAAKWIHAYTTLLQLGNSGYNRTAYYAKDTLGYNHISNTGAYDIKSFYDSLALGDIGVRNNYSNYWGGNTVKMAYILAMEAMECWLYRGTIDSVTNTSYTNRANKLATAITVWARKALADVANPLSYDNRTNFGAVHMSYVYDFLHSQMTKNQQDTVRMALIRMLPDSSQLNGFMTPSYTYISNWATFGYEIIPNLIVEGEVGHSAKDTGAVKNWCRSTWNFLTYGIYDKTGNVYEGLGKDQINAPLLVALAKRGYSMLGHPSVISYGSKYLPAIIQPFGYSFVGTDLLGGTGMNNYSMGLADDPATGSWKQNSIDPIGLKWAFPSDTAIDFVWKNYMQRIRANVPYNANLSPTYYAYSSLYDNYGAGWNTRIPALIFASDYLPTDFATQAQAAHGNNKMYFDSLGGFATLRSGFDSTATTVFFANRQDLGGHTYGNKNEFLLSALGRIWIPRPTSIANSEFDNHAFTGASSGILVNGYGVSVDTGAFNSAARVPGKMVYYKNASDILSIAGDATKAYSYNWMAQFGGYQGENPNLNPPFITAVTDNQNSFRYAPFYSFDNISFYNTLAFTGSAYPQSMPYYKRLVQEPFVNGVMKKVFRSISLIQASKPYVIVADDVQKDASTNNYKWICQLPSDLTIESTSVNLTNANYQNDIVLREAGSRRLLIRVLNNTGAVNTAVPATIDSAVYSFTKMRRLVIESNSVDPQFKVLFFAYNSGETIPVTTWSPDKSRVYISHNSTVNTVSFILDSLGRTNIELNSADTGINWTGAANTNWHNTANWSTGKIPTAADNVIVPSAGITNMPIIADSTAFAKRLSVYNGATLRLDSSLQLNGDLLCDGLITGTAILKTSSTSTTPLPNSKTWNTTIEFNNSNGNQFIPTGIYNNGLIINANIGTITSANGHLVVDQSLRVASGNTLNMSVYSMTGNNLMANGTGTIITQCTSNPSLPANVTWTQTVHFNAAAGGQFISSGTYQNLRLTHLQVGTLKDSVLGNIVVLDTLDVSSRSTLDLGTAQLGGTLSVLTGSGNISTNNTANNSGLPANKTWSGTVTYYSNNTQMVAIGSYNHLNLSSTNSGNRQLGNTNATDTIVIRGNLIAPTGTTNPNLTTVNFKGNGQVIQGMTFYNLDLTNAFATSFTASTITILNNFVPAAINTAGGVGTFNFAGNANQTIPVFAYNHLSVNTNGNTQFPNGATISTNALLTIGSGTILNIGNSTAIADASGITTSGSGTLSTTNTSANPIPSGRSWSFTVDFSNSSGIQTIPSGTYNNILISGNSGTDSASGNLTINGTLQLNSGTTLDMKSFNITAGSSFANVGLGTIRTRGTIPSNATWTGTMAFYSSTGFYTIVPGNYNHLDLDGGTGVSRNMDQGSGLGSGTFRISGNIISTAATVSCNRTTFILRGNNQTIPSGITWFNLRLDSATNFNFPTTINIGNQFTPGNSPASAPANTTINFTVPGGGVAQNANQTIPAFNYFNLGISGARTIYNEICTGTIGIAGTFTNSATFSSGRYLVDNSTFHFNGTGAQTIPAFNYFHLSISGVRNGNITLASGTIGIAGNYNRTATFTSGNMVVTNNTLLFNGTMDQSIASTSALTFNKWNINNTKSGGGIITIATPITINDTCTLTAGLVRLGNHSITLIGAVSGSNPTSYFVTDGNGLLIRNTIGVTPRLFPIGTASSFAPLTIAHTSGTGNVGTSVVSNLTNPVSNPNQIVNLQWSVNSSATTTATIIYQFNLSDGAPAFNAAANCELGTFSNQYTTNAIGLPTQNGSIYTDTVTNIGLSATSKLFVIGNVGAINCTPGTWLGGQLSNANDPNNWCGGLPNSTTNVVIANSTPRLTGNLSVNNLSLQSGINLNGSTLSVAGTISGNGLISGSVNSGLNITGKGTLFFDQTTNRSSNALNQLTINTSDTVFLGNHLCIYEFLHPTNGVIALSNSNITLMSSSIANTAQVGITNAQLLYNGNGRFIAERFLNNTRRGYRNLSSMGIFSDAFVYDNWQESATTNNNNPNPGYGMHITGIRGNAGTVDVATGLDATASGNASLWTYGLNDAFVAVSNTKAKKMFPYEGYFAVVRGNRSYELFAQNPAFNAASTTLRVTGKLATGTITLSSNTAPSWNFSGSTAHNFLLNKNTTPSGKNNNDYGFSLISNPYACAIDWQKVYNRSVALSTNGSLSPYYWVWNQAANNNNGAYVTVHQNGISTLPFNNSIIQPGQSFFVQNDHSGNDVVVSFQESDKITNKNSFPLKEVFGITSIDKIGLQLQTLINKDTIIADGAQILFNQAYSNEIDINDAGKYTNPYENIHIVQKKHLLSVSANQYPIVGDSLQIGLSNLRPQTSYVLQCELPPSFGTVSAWLKDNWLQTETPLTANTVVKIPFSSTTDSASYYNRFKLIFKQVALLPLRFTNLTVSVLNHSNRVQFSAINQYNIQKYTIEKSTDGAVYVPMTELNNNNQNSSFVEDTCLLPVCYYRIKATSSSGVTTYSASVKAVRGQSSLIRIYPTIVTQQSINVQFSSNNFLTYIISIYDANGKIFYCQNISATILKHHLAFAKYIPSGTYYLKIANNNQAVHLQKLIIK